MLQVTDSDHIHVKGGEMVIEDVMPSDGGLYSCMAVSVSGNASRDVAIHSEALVFLFCSVFMCRWTLKTLEMCLTLFCVFLDRSTTGRASLCHNLTWSSLSPVLAQTSAN